MELYAGWGVKLCVSDNGIGRARTLNHNQMMHQTGLSGIIAGCAEKAGRSVSRTSHALILLIALLLVSHAPLISAKERNPVSRPALSGPALHFVQPSLNPRTVFVDGSAYQQSGGVGYIGVFLGDIGEERARELQLLEVRGAVVGKVEDESPAARAGLAENDVILGVNDQKILNRAHFYRLISNSRPGSTVTLTISRNGNQRSVTIELGQRRVGIQDERKRLYSEADAMLAAAEDRRREADILRQNGDPEGARKLIEEEKLLRKQSEERRAYVEEQIKLGKIKENAGIQRPAYNISANRYTLGLTVVPIGEQLAQYFNTGESGVLVSEVRAGGAAEKVGIKAGDCIVAVNDDRVRSVSDLYRLIDRQSETATDKSEKSESEVVMTIIRDRTEQKVRVVL